MAPFSKSFSPPTSPDGMTVEVRPQSASQLSPLQDPFFYANIIQRVEKSGEFRNHIAPSPMDNEQNNNDNDNSKNNNTSSNKDNVNFASSEVEVEVESGAVAAASSSWEDEEEYYIPSPPKRRTSRNNFATVMQRLSSVTKPTVPSKKSVRFQDDSKNLLRLIREVESHRDYSTRERNRCWWSPSEKERCMSKHERVVSRMEHHKPCRKNETYRGLESWTSQGAGKLDQVINLCVDAVMDEQDYQWKVHKDDFTRIASICQRVTADSAKRARHVGMRDEREALLVREQSWAVDDDVTILSAMGASVMTAVKRKKKLALLRDRRDLSSKKPSKRMNKSSSKDKQKDKDKDYGKDRDNRKHSSSRSSTTVLEDPIPNKSETSTSSDKGVESLKNSSRKSRSDRSTKSTKKESSSSSSRSRKSKQEESGNRDYRRSSSNSCLSSSSKRKSPNTSSSKPDSTQPSSTTQSTIRNSSQFDGLIATGTPPTSFSSNSSTLDENSSSAAAIIGHSNPKSQLSHRSNKTTENKACIVEADRASLLIRNTVEPLSAAGAEGKSSDPPGRRAARSKSSHAEDRTLRLMQKQAKVPAAIKVKTTGTLP
jgi:hypothetical protein